MSGRFIPIRLRLTLWNISILALVLLALGAVLQYTMQAMLTASMDRDLEQRADIFAENWRKMMAHPPPGPQPGAPKPPPKANTPPPGSPSGMPNRPGPRPKAAPVKPAPQPDISKDVFARFWPRTLDTRGFPFFPWAKDVPWDRQLVASSARGASVFKTTYIGEEHARILSIPLRRDDNSIAGVIQVASSLGEMDRALMGLRSTLLILSLPALLACGLAGAFLTGRAMRPVRHISQASSRIGAGNLSERLQVSGNDEFAELAVTINGMLGRLDDAFSQLAQAYEQQRRFTADASHELRTPLTAIKGNVSLALASDRTPAEYREALTATNQAADRMNRIVQDLLFLARSDAGQFPMKRRIIEIPELLQSAAEAVQGEEQAAVQVVTKEPLPPFCGDSSHLLRLLVNLLQNALRHTPPEGRIVLSGEADKTMLTLRVQDTGEGIAAEHLPHICERFYRVDAARTRSQGGTGLGLSICQSIVAAHSGTMQIESEVGKGTLVTIRLPYDARQTA